MWLHGLGRYVCLSLVLVWLGGFVGCGGPVPIRRGGTRPDAPPGQDAAFSAFKAAERAYEQKDYMRARALFEAFLQQYSQSPLVADASFRVGELFYYEGQYDASQRVLEQFLATFPRSRLTPEATHLLGLALLELKRLPQARAALEQAQRLSPEPRFQGRMRLALVKVATAEGQHVGAIEELRGIMGNSQFPSDVRQQAKELGIDLVTRLLTANELAEIKRRWPLEFPTDYALLRQAQSAWSRQESTLAQTLSEEFLQKFPEHSEAPTIQALLATIGQARSGRVDKDKIGVILPLSARPGREWVSEVGESSLRGIQAAFAREGFNPLKLEVRDSRADVTTAMAMAEDLINGQHVIALVGPILNDTTEAASRKATLYGVPLLTPGAPFGEFPKNSPYVFRAGLTDRLEARRLAEYAVGTLGLRRFAILYPNDRAGREIADIFQTRVGEFGGEVIAREGYEPNRVDFTPQMRRLGGKTDEELGRSSAGAGGGLSGRGQAEAAPAPGRLPYEALYLPRSFERLQFLVSALRLLNITGITLLGESGWNHPELSRRGGSFLEGAVFMDGFFAGSPDPQVREFVRSYRTMFTVDP
ncbi:MAG: penicillin-binding protein activator, partial [Nitrospinae bacterium]|nr:penicillin-binding protein activator [Nitrospinota bacterium]